jgi:hypothetical protein
MENPIEKFDSWWGHVGYQVRVVGQAEAVEIYVVVTNDFLRSERCRKAWSKSQRY